MGFAIANPGRYQRFVIVPRDNRPIGRWPSPPDIPENPAANWELVGFLGENPPAAVYGLLELEYRMKPGFAKRMLELVENAKNRHEERALTKAQVKEVLDGLLTELVMDSMENEE